MWQWSKSKGGCETLPLCLWKARGLRENQKQLVPPHTLNTRMWASMPAESFRVSLVSSCLLNSSLGQHSALTITSRAHQFTCLLEKKNISFLPRGRTVMAERIIPQITYFAMDSLPYDSSRIHVSMCHFHVLIQWPGYLLHGITIMLQKYTPGRY